MLLALQFQLLKHNDRLWNKICVRGQAIYGAMLALSIAIVSKMYQICHGEFAKSFVLLWCTTAFLPHMELTSFQRSGPAIFVHRSEKT